MSHQGLNIADLVTGITIMLLVAAVTTIASKRLPKVPLTIALVFVGMAIAEFADHVPGLDIIGDFELTPELVLFVFIPTLIFESAFNLNARQVARNIWPILTMAVPGLLLSTAIIGMMMAALTDFDIMVALLLGAILSATDPVAVIAIFRQLGVPERLTILVEGESLFNDATSLVLATLLVGILAAGTFTLDSVGDGVLEFFVVFFGGVLVGWMLALIAGQTLGGIKSDAAIEITLTTTLAYFAFIIAEHVFHVSGIMAVVAAGLIMGSWGKSKISPSTESFMEHFWEYLSYLANVLIFLMVGMQIDLAVLWDSVDLIAYVVLAMLVSRLCVIFGLVPIVGKLPGSQPIGFGYSLVMYWGGLRGAIALAIVLSLPENAFKQTLIAVVMGAVLFTLVFQGLSIELLVKRLGLDRLSLPDRLAKLEGDRQARREGLERLDALASGGVFSERIADNLREKTQFELARLEEEIDELHVEMSSEEDQRILAMRCLVRENARYQELFARGLINEWAYRELRHTIDVQLDEARHRGRLPSVEFGVSTGKALDLFLIDYLRHIPGLGGLVEYLRTQRTIRDYDIAWGRYRGANSVLGDLAGLAGNGDLDTAVSDEVRDVYLMIRETMKSQLDEMEEVYPEFVSAMQEQLGQRLLLIAERESVEESAAMGKIQEGIAQQILKDQNERIRHLKRDEITACFEIEANELLRKVPVFQGIEEKQFETISTYLRARTFPRGSHMIEQGASGSSMFLIARGIANVFIRSGDETSQVATLYSGDFFGEGAMLHEGQRNATIIAATPCSVYELRGEDLDRICEHHPAIRREVERVDAARIKANTTRQGHQDS